MQWGGEHLFRSRGGGGCAIMQSGLVKADLMPRVDHQANCAHNHQESVSATVE